jgi:hypothetical protein
LYPEKLEVSGLSLPEVFSLTFRSLIARDAFLLIEEFSLPGSGRSKFQPALQSYLENWIKEFSDTPLEWELIGRKIHPEHLEWTQEILEKFTAKETKQAISSPPNKNSVHFDSKLRMSLFAFRDSWGLGISLQHEKLYRRGFRLPLANSAPLSEDIASALIQKTLGPGPLFPKSIVLVPFSGTGTFCTEAFFNFYKIPITGINPRSGSDHPLDSRLDLRKWRIFHVSKSHQILSESIHFPLVAEKGIPRSNFWEDSGFLALRIFGYDKNPEAVRNSRRNLENLATWISGEKVLKPEETLPIHIRDGDFSQLGILGFLRECEKIPNSESSTSGLTYPISDSQSPISGSPLPVRETVSEFSLTQPNTPIIVFLNPPYGIRMGESSSAQKPLYSRIALEINHLANYFPNRPISGAILIPNEDIYFGFLRDLDPNWEKETIHFSQGVLSLRAVIFSKHSGKIS